MSTKASGIGVIARDRDNRLLGGINIWNQSERAKILGAKAILEGVRLVEDRGWNLIVLDLDSKVVIN